MKLLLSLAVPALAPLTFCARADDIDGYRSELVRLITLAEDLSSAGTALGAQ